jgi:hypothetical protein
MKSSYMLALVLAAGVVISAFGTEASAQQKQKFLFKAPPGVSKYEEQHAIDVGDVPGHQVRVYSSHAAYAQEAPVFDGVKVKEESVRALTDYTEGNGHLTGYTVYLLENGDKIFTRNEAITQTTVNADGSKVTKTYGVRTLTGGTGKFKSIRGTLHSVSTTDFKAVGEVVVEGEYWLE